MPESSPPPRGGPPPRPLSLLDEAVDGIFLTDPGGRLLESNRRGCTMLGYEPGELDDVHVREILAPGELERAPLRDGDLPPGERLVFDRCVRRKDGTSFFVEVGLSRLADGRFLAILRDITQRKEAERDARRGAETFRALLERFPDGVAVHQNGRFVYVNNAVLALLGATGASELVGRRILDVVHPEERDVVSARLEEVERRGRAAPLREERLLRLDGAEIRAEVMGVPVEFDGAPAVVVVMRDVSEQRRLQDRLAQADRLASVGLLAAGVAHEVNNPLAYALLNLERLARDLPKLLGNVEDATADRLLGCLHDAIDGARRVQRIVRELRTFARTSPDERRAVDINAVLTHSLDLAANQLRFRARVVRDLGHVPEVMGDEGRLTQVFVNLLINAAHSIEEGQVEQNEVRVRTYLDGNTVRVEVADSGEGIPPENVPRLFDPFFTTKEPGRGSGLGLSISHSIARAHGGHITVDTAPGKGSRFVVHLPAIRDAGRVTPPPISSPGARPSGSPQRKRVLLVDDEQLLRSVLASLLAPRYEIVPADSGAAAIRILASDARFDAIVCDLMMPDVSGMDVYEWLGRERPTLLPRIVLMTGGAFTERGKALLDQAPVLRIDKPFEIDELSAMIERASGDGD